MSTFYITNAYHSGDILLKYNGEEYTSIGYCYCDNVLIPVPDSCIIDSDVSHYSIEFYYYNRESLKGYIADFFTRVSFEFKGRGNFEFPFIVFKNDKPLKKFKEFLKKNIQVFKDTEKYNRIKRKISS